jgi:hypothetical protein
VTEGYLKAWSEFGVRNDNGHFNMMVMEEERVVVTPEAPWSDFWLGALMHSWNPDFVEASYARQMARWLRPGPRDTAWIAIPEFMTENETAASARDFGWAAVCASEVGDLETRDRLLAYADAYLHARWTRGGYHYARHDELFDEDGLFRCMDPHTGNALLGYARLNVPGGLRGLYEGGWNTSHHDEPALDDLPENLDVTAARFDRDDRRLAVSLAGDTAEDERLLFSNVWNRGAWTLQVDGQTVAEGHAGNTSSVGAGVSVERLDDHLAVHLPIARKADVAIRWQ